MDASEHQLDKAVSGEPSRRRNRDDPSRGGSPASAHGPTTIAPNAPIAGLPQQQAQEQRTSPDSIEDVLARGHRWLRFPSALETQFQADSENGRRKLLVACGVLGCVGVLVATADIQSLAPGVGPLLSSVVRIWATVAAISIAILLFTPMRWRRNWQGESLTFVMALSVSAFDIWMPTASHADTAFTHSGQASIPVMYACIAARQRFRWALGGAILSFLGYVIFVKGFTPVQDLVVAGNIKLMALSYVFVLAANYTFEHRERRNWLLRKLDGQRRVALNESSERLRMLAIKDPLTGLFNRRQFDTDLALAWSNAASAKQPVAMVMVDVDFFKRYNDTYGHAAGDSCLIQVSQALDKVAQAHGGIAARLGGEEFALLMPGRTLQDAMEAGAALCEGVRAARIEHRASTVSGHVTVSVGAAQAFAATGSEPQALVTLADDALYRAKESGRNRVCAVDAVPAKEPPDHEPAPALHTGAESAAAESADATVMQPGESSGPANPEAAYMRTVAGKFLKLRFPADQETDYRDHDRDQRRKHLAVMGALGVVVYNVYTASSIAMFPDIQGKVRLMQAGLSAIVLFLIAASYAIALPARWREAVFSFGTALIGVVSAWVLSQSHQLTALNYSVCLVLIPMFSGVAARQPFWFACVPAVATCVAAALFFKPVGPVQTLVHFDSVFTIINNTVYTLILAYTLEYGARKEWLLSKIERLRRDALLAVTRKLHQMSVLDPLTGLSNRRQFEEDFQRIWLEHQRDHQPLAILIIDVDFFKLYNDGYGHPQGDRCLRQVSAVIRETALAAKGLAARLGGEEFSVLLPGATIAQATQLGEHVCAAVRQAGLEHRYSKVDGQQTVTVSVGAGSLVPDKGSNRRSLFAIADDALYHAKNSGRNRVAALSVPPKPSCAKDAVT